VASPNPITSNPKVVSMSIWTPGGEIPVERGGDSGPGSGGSPAPGGAGAHPGPNDEAVRNAAEAMGIDPDTLSPEDRVRLVELVEQMAEAQQRLANAPAGEVVANHAMGLYEFAAIKLGSQPPQLADARLAIDALGGLMEAAGSELGPHGDALQQALDSIRVAWVQVSDAVAGEGA